MALGKAIFDPANLVGAKASGGSKPYDNIAVKVTGFNLDGKNTTITGKRLDTGEEITVRQDDNKSCPLEIKLSLRKDTHINASTGISDDLLKKYSGIERLGTQIGIGKGSTVILERAYSDENNNLVAGRISGLNQFERESKIVNDGKPVPVSLMLYRDGKAYDYETKSFEKVPVAGINTMVRPDLGACVSGSINDIIDAAVKASENQFNEYGMSRSAKIYIIDPDTGTTLRPVTVSTLTKEGWAAKLDVIKKKQGAQSPTKDQYLTGEQRSDDVREKLTRLFENLKAKDSSGNVVDRKNFDVELFPSASVVIISSTSMTKTDLKKMSFAITSMDYNSQIYGSFKDAVSAQRDQNGQRYYPGLLIKDSPNDGAVYTYSYLDMSKPELSQAEAIADAVASQYPAANREAVVSGVEYIHDAVNASYKNRGAAESNAPKGDAPKDDAPKGDVPDAKSINADFDGDFDGDFDDGFDASAFDTPIDVLAEPGN